MSASKIEEEQEKDPGSEIGEKKVEEEEEEEEEVAPPAVTEDLSRKRSKRPWMDL
jgi:hypothetical protein